MVPQVKKVNEPHSVVNIKLGVELFACRVWPWNDIFTNNLDLHDYVDIKKDLNDLDKLAIVVALSDLNLNDIEYMVDYDFMKVYNEIVSITLQGGH